MLLIERLPEGYKNSRGTEIGGFWGAYKNKRLMARDKNRHSLMKALDLDDYCFEAACYERGELVWVVKMEDAASVDKFLDNSKPYHVNGVSHNCSIYIQKLFTAQQVFDFKALGSEALKRAALAS